MGVFTRGDQIIKLYSRIEFISEKYNVLRVNGLVKSLHVLLMTNSIDDDLLDVAKCLLKVKLEKKVISKSRISTTR